MLKQNTASILQEWIMGRSSVCKRPIIHGTRPEQIQACKTSRRFGLRLKFNKYSDSNITFDIAFGKESFNWYVI